MNCEGNMHSTVDFDAVDISVYHDGFHGDLNETFFVGKVNEDSKKLVNVAYECLMAGISIGMLYSICQLING